MVDATIVEFCKGLLDGDRLIIKTILYIRVALTSERLVSRFFNDKLAFTKTSMSGAILWAVYKFCPVPKISQVMVKRRRRASHLGRFTLRNNGRRATQLGRFTLALRLPSYTTQ